MAPAVFRLSKAIWALFLLLSLLFIFLRFYKISDSLFFFNDNGRDFLILHQWLQTGKPPLLGPQNSALPFNQSAFYFYLLFPAFLLTRQSPLSPLMVNAFLYLGSFFFCLLLSRHHPRLQKALLWVLFVISIHPQYIIQNRYIWNPSFVTPFLLVAIICLYLQTKKFTVGKVWLIAFALVTAVSVSYSVAPVFLAIVLYYFLFIRQKPLAFLLALFTALLAINLPTIIFEFRHHFLLTGSLLSKSYPVQSELALPLKLRNLVSHTIMSDSLLINSVFFSVVIFLIIISGKKVYRSFSFILLTSILLTLLAPFTLQSHYIFGILTLFLLASSLLPKAISLSSLAIFSFLYLQPSRLSAYFAPAPRTYGQMAECFKSVCRQETGPLFVTVQSSLHPYHVGPEHRYLMKKQGCNVKEIESEPQSADTMAVVVDDGDYNHNQTSYYELSLFGPSQIKNIIPCQNNFKVVVLKKSR
ncbi:MAG: hypothetical protein WC686_01440 [Candidatus Shapirobacteria bacterium]|jgi:hypothetical protein